MENRADHPDIFDTHIVTKLNEDDVDSFTTLIVKVEGRYKGRMCNCTAFKIGDFDTTSTLSWALERCSEEKERFCSKWLRMKLRIASIFMLKGVLG